MVTDKIHTLQMCEMGQQLATLSTDDIVRSNAPKIQDDEFQAPERITLVAKGRSQRALEDLQLFSFGLHRVPCHHTVYFGNDHVS